MKDTWKEAVHNQRIELAQMLSEPLAHTAGRCVSVWGQREEIDKILMEELASVPQCLFMYALDVNGIQISDNVSRTGLMPDHFGRDRSDRPYMREAVPSWGFLLSDAYLSYRANRPSLTALQIVTRDEVPLGYIGADFDLRDLPVTAEIYEESHDWRQIKGDPAIRGSVFQQCRVDSLLDNNLTTACAIIEELITDRGMFQGVIHFSSSRATIWLGSDPFRYRILDAEALSDPDICLLYKAATYPEEAEIPKDRISSVLHAMCKLRMADEVLYLRSSSINIFNGMISLTFSCDGTHYMSWEEFLQKDVTFWTGCAA